jgi:hypothetical protein
MFNWKSLAFGAAMFFVGGVVDFTFFHNHELGKAVIAYFDPMLQHIYDFVSVAIGLPQYAHNPAFMSAAGTACLTGVDALGMPIPGC